MAAAVTLPRSIETIAPFRRSREAHEPLAATVSGAIPAWLRGELVRTCPAVFETSGWRAEHWFDGLAMLYAFTIDDESAVSFRSRLLDSEIARDASNGRARIGSFGTALRRNLLQRIFEPVPRVTDNMNVNIVKMGDDLVAMTEGKRQIVVNPETLSAQGPVPYDDDLPGVVMSAHPHFDFARGRVVNLATKIGPSSTLSIYEHAPTSRRREVVGTWRTSRIPYVHSFGLTEKTAIILAHPLTAKPTSMLWSNRGFIDHFEWRPEEGTRLILMDRATGATREHTVDAFFVFHTVHAFERDGETVVDVLAYANADIVRALRVDQIKGRLPDLRASLTRITMRPGAPRATLETLTDVGFEFPATSYKRISGGDYEFVWGASDGPTEGNAFASSRRTMQPSTRALLSVEPPRDALLTLPEASICQATVTPPRRLGFRCASLS
jgi:beta,beta-carotene 9',10'-dioxygenase